MSLRTSCEYRSGEIMLAVFELHILCSRIMNRHMRDVNGISGVIGGCDMAGMVYGWQEKYHLVAKIGEQPLETCFGSIKPWLGLPSICSLDLATLRHYCLGEYTTLTRKEFIYQPASSIYKSSVYIRLCRSVRRMLWLF